MAESKRTFQAARMDKDIDDRLLKPGQYRDGLNISIDTSEDANVGAVENLKGIPNAILIVVITISIILQISRQTICWH